MFIRYVLQVSCYFLGVPNGSNLHVLSAHVLYLFTPKVHVVPVGPMWCVYIALEYTCYVINKIQACSKISFGWKENFNNSLEHVGTGRLEQSNIFYIYHSSTAARLSNIAAGS